MVTLLRGRTVPVGFLSLVLCFLFVSVALVESSTTWPCTFQFGNNSYDLTPISDILFDAIDGGSNDYYFKVCDPTTVAGNISPTKPCDDGTQVCQESVTTGVSCGIGPPSTSELTTLGGVATSGVVMQTSGGVVGCGSVPRSTTINIACLDDFTGKSEGSLDPMDENPACVYTVNLYSETACPTSSTSPSVRCCIYGNASTSDLSCAAMEWTSNFNCLPVQGMPFWASFPADDCNSCFDKCSNADKRR
mmetsp:Transcript_27663/g.77346  ORF Transcript_27663/g.77346 Transcript_27663/m.77346 type:complete len:248 (-) Transcript_27663:153-896(-)|eukprot:CAMPEP_0119132254 /NCGR_PEP_ID=MMETSP1310-20130426/11741_1 /TAXON_ID=464262 /ORGANISM="Genus nov. species nov., Strain RCC2339" /LENGTH=247 /DNA_ID=CAMNT_0007122879 /DNA_START=89 /DNA_END=832 /DNA_ORIENTATION=-